MRIDPSDFYRINVTDTCAVWNVLSSQCLYSVADTSGVVFCCTRYVIYECMQKPRTRETEEEKTLLRRLRRAQNNDQFETYEVSIEALQDPEILELRDRLGHGELSAIVFALNTGQAVMTDDQKARKSAESVMPIALVQTTPKLFGWLLYKGHLADSDKDTVVRQHEEIELRQPLTAYFEEMHRWALECRLKTPRYSPSDDS